MTKKKVNNLNYRGKPVNYAFWNIGAVAIGIIGFIYYLAKDNKVVALIWLILGLGGAARNETWRRRDWKSPVWLVSYTVLAAVLIYLYLRYVANAKP